MPSVKAILIAAAVLTPLVCSAADAQNDRGGGPRGGGISRGGGGGGGGFNRGGGGAGAAALGGGAGAVGAFNRGGGPRAGGGYVGGGSGYGGYRGGYRGGYYGPRYRGWYGPRYGSSFFIGGYYPFYDPFWPYPYYYPYGYGFGYSYYAPRTAYTEPVPPPEGYLGPSGPPPAQDWYYCDNPEGYYPYVRTCNGQWQAVPAQPEGAPPENRSGDNGPNPNEEQGG